MNERQTLFVDLILPVPIRQLFTYRVPFELNEQIQEGVRVIVPFGKSKLITGIVTKIHDQVPKDFQVKYIENILDEQPIITAFQLKLWHWISTYYLSPIGDVMNAALPSNLKLASETIILIHEDYEDKGELNDKENQIMEALAINESMNLSEISKLLSIKSIYPIIKKMMDKKMIISQEEIYQRFQAKTKSFIELHEAMEDEEVLQDALTRLEQRKSSEKQLEAMMLILRDGQYAFGKIEAIEKSKIIEQGVSASTLQTLVAKDIIKITKYEVSRFDSKEADVNEFKALSPAQKKSLDELNASMEQHNTSLFFGVTGSGKTEVYVQLIQEQLDLGKQVLFLIPEIALTTQLIKRLSFYFGELVGVYHSKFNQNERVEIWNHVLANDMNKFRIILGARSSLFLPYRNLGLVIVDEEHETSFKQYDPSPRYNARDTAIILAHMHQAKVILGSATPSIESFYNAKNQKYGFVKLEERFGNLQLPEIFVADVKKERQQKKMNSHFSSMLIEHINESLAKNEQVILFQNRRGYTPFWTCQICEWVPKCINCDISLTYHKFSNILKCHYCSYTTSPMGTCGQCGSNRIQMNGFGTEKIEDELQLLYPDKIIKRLDYDSTRSKNAYENIINDFADKRTDILIGTQMVSKGLDFDNVSLVGILDADHLLNRVDFRAFERGFQMMSQVSGRAGRKNKRGKVVVQTANPDHWIIQKVIEHDYESFYQAEIIERKNFFYPPFYKIISLTLKHKDTKQLDASATTFADTLKAVFKERVLGPDYPIIKKINNFYQKNIIIKIERELSDTKVKQKVQEIIDAFYTNPSSKSVQIIIDVDPY